MTIVGRLLSAMMAGGARPSVKMAKAGLDDDVGRESSAMTSVAGGKAMTIGGCLLSVMMAGGVRPLVKMAKAALDDEVGSDSSMATSGAG